MTSILYYYVKRIIFFLIFTSFIQILFLNNKYKNYLQLVLSLMLIFVMLQPLKDVYISAKLKNLDKYIEDVKASDFEVLDEQYLKIQNEMVLDLFEQNIKLQTQKIVGQRYEIIDFELDLVEDKSYQTIIKKMYITLAKEGEKMVYVKPFDNKDENINSEEDEKEINRLKNMIYNFYNLSLDNIFITIT